MGLAYKTHEINIMKDDQFAPDFLKISPNNKIPALVDQDTGQTIFESGACLIYLAQKTGMFLPEGAGQWPVYEWLMWQMGGFGPMLGQAHHFLQFNPGKAPYAEERFGGEAARLYGVLDRQLSANAYVAGAELSIADFAIWPWASRFEWQRIDLSNFEHVARWYTELAARPGFQKGYNMPGRTDSIPLP